MLKDALKLHLKGFIEIATKYLKDAEKRVQNSGEARLIKAMQYSLISENAKYIRSFLVFETAKMLGSEVNEDIQNLALAVEMMHCYSLIHDDLPAMDNAEFRRGKEALHIKFGESTAIMAGNALQVFAFEILADFNKPEIIREMIREMANACGLYGILGGQVLDLEESLKISEFDEMNYKKTAVLFEFCLASVAILLEKPDVIPALKLYGKNLGIAFQMQDDILDEGEGGYSYINHLGSAGVVKKKLEEKLKKCEDIISGFENSGILANLPKFLANRVY